MLTAEDIKNLSDYFATKEDLRRLEEKMVTKEQFNSFKDQTLTTLDVVVGEIKGMRFELASHLSLYNRIDKRVSVVESTPTVSRELKSK